MKFQKRTFGREDSPQGHFAGSWMSRLAKCPSRFGCKRCHSGRSKLHLEAMNWKGKNVNTEHRKLEKLLAGTYSDRYIVLHDCISSCVFRALQQTPTSQDHGTAAVDDSSAATVSVDAYISFPRSPRSK